MNKNNKAFTLIELLVVVLILGILAAVALPQYQKAVYQARAVQFVAMLDAYKKAVDVYVLENGFENVTILGEGDEDYPLVNLDIDFPAVKAQELIEYYKGNGQGGTLTCESGMQLCALTWAGDKCDFGFQKDIDNPSWTITQCDGIDNEGEVFCNYLQQVY